MNCSDLLKDRYSVRRYKNTPVPQEIIDSIIDAAVCAPTAHNNQPQHIIVVNSKKGIELLNKCTECHYGAPLAFIISYDKNKDWVRSYDGKHSGDIDGAIVTTHMMLEATRLGLGTTWLMFFIPEAVKTEFELPDNIEPVALLLAGYSDMEPSPNHLNRLSPDKYVTYR